MKKLLILICSLFMFSSCSEMLEGVATDIADDVADHYADNYCDGMEDSDGDGYYMKYLYNSGGVYEIDMLCDLVIIPISYQMNTYDVLRAYDCQFRRITEVELISDIECEVLEPVPEEYELLLAIN